MYMNLSYLYVIIELLLMQHTAVKFCDLNNFYDYNYFNGIDEIQNNIIINIVLQIVLCQYLSSLYVLKE